MAAAEHAASEAPTAGEYILHHLTFLKNHEPKGIIDFSVVHWDSVFFSVLLDVLFAGSFWFVARRAFVTSIANLAQMAGLVVLPLLAHLAMQPWGWRAGWLAVGGLLGAALLAPSAALATDLKDAQQGTAWNDQGFQGNANDPYWQTGQNALQLVLWNSFLSERSLNFDYTMIPGAAGGRDAREFAAAPSGGLA